MTFTITTKKQKGLLVQTLPMNQTLQLSISKLLNALFVICVAGNVIFSSRLKYS